MTHYTTALIGYKPICGNESNTDLWTSEIELTDCLKCINRVNIRHEAQYPPPDLFPNAPNIEEVGGDAVLGHKECIIADALLDRIRKFQTKWEEIRKEDHTQRVSDYLAFMQACQIRQQIGKQQREERALKDVSDFRKWAAGKASSEFEEATK